MIVNYGAIEVKGKCGIPEGFIEISTPGITLIEGENGSGKTLLAKNILRKCKKENINVSMVDQNNSMILRKENILTNISMSTDIAEQERVKEIVKKNGLEKILCLDSSKLSGGEKRLICILRELVKSNDILIIDEPTNDLSDEWCDLLLDLIRKYSNSFSVIVISHDDRIKNIATRIINVSRSDGIKVCREDNVEISNDFLDVNKKIFSKRLLKNNFSLSPLLVLFLLMQIILLTMYLLNNNSKIVDLEYESDRTEIYLSNSQSAEIYKEYSLSARMVSFVNGEATLLEVYRNQQVEDERLSHKSVSFCLEEVYEVMSSKIMIKELFLPHQDEYLNATTLGIDSERELDLALREILNQDKVFITHMTVIGSEGQDEIIQKIKELELLNTKTYLYNNEIKNIVDGLMIITDTKSVVKIEALLILVIMFGLVFYYRNNRKDKKTAILFYQYGYDKKEIVFNATKKMESYLIFIVTTFVNCGISFCLYKIQKLDIRYAIVELLVITFASYIVLVSDIWLKRKSIKKSFSWKWR